MTRGEAPRSSTSSASPKQGHALQISLDYDEAQSDLIKVGFRPGRAGNELLQHVHSQTVVRRRPFDKKSVANGDSHLRREVGPWRELQLLCLPADTL